MNKSIRIIIVIIVVFANNLFAQKEIKLSTTNKKAIKLYNEGKEYYDARKNELAELTFREAIARDPNFIEAELLLAYVYTDMIQYKKALTHYERCIEIDPQFFPEMYSSSAAIALKFGMYEKAQKYFKAYLGFQGAPLMMKNLGGKILNEINF